MAFLLDINVLIARVDPCHEHHKRARRWLKEQTGADLVTCPLTENGFVRIYGHPSYPGGPGSPALALEELRVIRSMSCHRFIADTLSLDDPHAFHSLEGISPKQLTDLYLLALAARHQISFATLDGSIPSGRVVGGPATLVVIA